MYTIFLPVFLTEIAVEILIATYDCLIYIIAEFNMLSLSNEISQALIHIKHLSIYLW